MMDKREDATVGFVIPDDEQMPSPEVANYFHFAFAGGDVQMLAGYIDLRVVHEARIKGQRSIAPEISHRLVLSPQAFAHLRRQLDDIAQKYDAIQAKNRLEAARG